MPARIVSGWVLILINVHFQPRVGCNKLPPPFHAASTQNLRCRKIGGPLEHGERVRNGLENRLWCTPWCRHPVEERNPPGDLHMQEGSGVSPEGASESMQPIRPPASNRI